MIIKISQTASNVKQSYDIKGDGFYYSGDTGRISRFQTITISNKDSALKGVFTFSKWVNYIPYRWLFGKPNITQAFNLYKNENIYGNITFSKHGFFKSCYIITLDNGEIFHCYCRSKSSFDYVSIYKGDQQIALLETYLSVNDFKYTHKLYLLDDYNKFAETFSLFVLYYASFNFAQRFHMTKGSTYGKEWTISRYNNKYDKNWRETHFPNENFFGKINLFS